MTVVSKFVDDAIHKYESLGYSKLRLSQGIVGACLCAYVVRLAYPAIKKQINKTDQDASAQKIIDNNGNDNSTKNCQHEELNSDDDSCQNEESLSVLDVKQQIEKAEKLLANANQTPNIGLNIDFLLQLKRLLHIMIPKLVCRETCILGVHTVCLVSRTFLSILVAAMEGAIVKYIVRKDVRNFAIMLMKWFAIAIPATFVNSMIRFLENKLALAFRTRLVSHSYRLYFKNQTYYRVSNLDGRIENADQRLTEDISTFASSVAHLYSHLTKPCFDLMLIGLALMRSSQKMKANIISGPLLGFVVISTTAHILRIVSPKFGQLVSEEANRYGYLRHIHSRIITNAEEIAFYGGHKVELLQLREAYNRLTSQMNTIFSQRLWFVMLEQFFMKYVWSGTGMIMVSLPILTASKQKCKFDEDIQRLMSSYKEIVSLAGYTHRVAGMLEIFEETSKGIYDKTTVCDERNTAGILKFDRGRPIAQGRIVYASDPEDRKISLKSVPIVTPNCDIVVPSLTLDIEPGMHLLITGPNGCGKSSLFRILSGLWPIYGGELYIPKPNDGTPCMFYIPQRPYLSIGSLRDQIIYPDTVEDMVKKNIKEDKLWEIMKMVSLEHIIARDNFDVVRDWKDILSGGEKQRMAIARLFYHRPRYALLDECTSAVSIDVESSMYEAIISAGITLMTITHRPTLWYKTKKTCLRRRTQDHFLFTGNSTPMFWSSMAKVDGASKRWLIMLKEILTLQRTIIEGFFF
ncbi:hypothetical protein HA402_009146 [Bradysia odoriphaga]|nr:hypothetical protein HA402_009146 [Bradysia odoriphaga]